jgi:hypothetical protein
MWKLIKKLFTPKRQEKPLLLENELKKKKMTKGDLKKLLAQGKIKSIYNIK